MNTCVHICVCVCVNTKESQTQLLGGNQKSLPVILRFGLGRMQHHSILEASYALNISCGSNCGYLTWFSAKSAMMFVLAPKKPEPESGR